MSDRHSLKPNSRRRAAYRMALAGRDCATCLLPVAWDGAAGQDRQAGSATIGHNVSLDLCQSYAPEYVDVQCWACNWSANAAGVLDQSGDWQVRAWHLPAQKEADAWRACEVRGDASNLPGWGARKYARHLRGIKW